MNSPLLPEALVNSITVGSQTSPNVASLLDGSYVVTWVSPDQDGSGSAIIAQRFTAAGQQIGNAFIVNSTQVSTQSDPSIVGTDDGGFVIVWESLNQDVPASFDFGVFGQRFGADGLPAGDEFQINETNVTFTQFDPEVAAIPGGGFAVAFTDDSGDGNADGIRVRFYDAAGVPTGTDIQVNSETASNQSLPAIGTINASAGANGLASGGVVVIWTSPTSGTAGDGSGDGVFGQIYDASGAAVGTEFLVNTQTTNQQTDASVAGLAGGRFVVVWEDTNGTDGSGVGVFGQIYEGDGTAVGGEFQINVETASSQFDPEVTGTDDGGFVVTWTSSTSGTAGDGNGQGIIGRRFDMDGTPTSGELIINEQITSTQETSDVAALPNGDFVAVWSSATSGAAGDGSGSGIFQRIFGDTNTFTAPSDSPLVEAVSTSRTFLEEDLNAGPQRLDADGAAAVSDADSTDFDGGRLVLSVIARNEVEDGFGAQDSTGQFSFGLDTSGTISVSGTDVLIGTTVVGSVTESGTGGSSLAITFNAAADAAAVELLVENLTIENLSDDPTSGVTLSLIVEDGDGAASEPVLIDVDITPEMDGDGFVGTERRVNTVTVGNQSDSAIDGLADGGYISVWTSTNQDNPGDGDTGVFAQRYDANGIAVGAEFQVNTTVAQSQFNASVAGLNDGGWVIVWRDDTTTGIKLNRYDATGTVTVTELQVETESQATQFEPQVAALTNGGYVVTWTSQSSGNAGDGSSNAMIAQIFNAAGARVGAEISVNQQTTGAQDTGAVSALAGGGFVVVWEENDVASGDGSGSSVNARVFDDAGLPVSGDIQVNSFTNGAQSNPKVATLANGDFVVTWRSTGQDTSSGGIYYQRYDATGVALGDEIRVNDRFEGDQTLSDIIALDTGGFAISFVDTSTLPPGSGSDVFVQVFDADGTRIDSQVLVNTEVASTQNEATLAALPNGNFVVQWTSATSGTAGDGNSNGIFQQIIGDPAEIAQSAPPVLSGLPLAVDITEAQAEGGSLFVIDGGLTVLDSDSADFAGGSVRVTRIVTDPLQDEFNAPDDATQDSVFVAVGGPISITGTTVSVNGTAVATIASDGAAGAELVLNFLAGATLANAEAVLNALTYQNDSDNPRDSRTYSITVDDGDGGLTQSQAIEIRLSQTPETGAPERVGAEDQVNTFTTGDQQDPHVATLDDGGWVVVWTSANQDGASNGVYMQRYSSEGARIGGEVKVSSTDTNNANDAVVTSLENGGWVVAWEADGVDAPSDFGILSQRYNADGSAAGGETVVNITTSFTQFDADVATISAGTPGFPTGGYVVVYTSDVADGSSDGIVLQRFATDGTPVGGEIVVNTVTAGNQSTADVTVLNNGLIAVTYFNPGDAVAARVFNPDGTEAVAEFKVGNPTDNGQQPAIASTADGGFVIVWEDNTGRDGSGQGIVAQRYDATGTAVGGSFVVNEQISSTQGEPDVIGLTDGRFVVTWRDFFNGVDGSGDATLAQVYSATGERLDEAFVVNTTTLSTQFSPELAALPDGNFVAVYGSVTSGTSGDGSGNGVFQQVYGDPADFTPGVAPVLQGTPDSVTFSEADVNAGFERLDADKTIALGDLDAASFDGGSLTLAVAFAGNRTDQPAPGDDSTQDQLGLVAGDVGNGDVQFTGLSVGDTVSVDGTTVGTISAAGQTFTIDFNSSSTVEAVEAILGNLGYANLSDGPDQDRRLSIDVQDGTGLSAPTAFIDVTVTQSADAALVAGDEFGVNTHTDNEQSAPVTVELAGGGFVVVWTSTGQDGLNTLNDTGVYAQLYTSAGVPVGREFLVNTTTASTQNVPDVAATSDGGFVVVWQAFGVDAVSDFGVVGQRFTATGATNGGEFVVNTATASTQGDPEVAAFADGGFVVTYFSDNGDGNGDAILSQRFDAAGAPDGAETVVNTVNTVGNQSQPAVATLVDGLGNNAGHVVVFTSPTSGATGDGDGNGVFAQRYDATGAPAGAEFQVNTLTTANQSDASVIGLTGGGFVVVWTDSVADGSSNGVFGQIYDETGAAVGGEFRINTDTFNSESDAQVAAMSDGGFVVTWTAGSTQDGSGDGVYGQRFTATGNRLDGEFQVNEAISSNQNQSDVTAVGDGFFVAYRAETSLDSGDGSSGGITGRLYETVASVDTSPDLGDLDRAVTLFADDVTTSAQILDDGVSFDDPDGGNFGGGSLQIYFTAGETANDQLSIATDAQVTLAGSTLSVGGTAIGTIDGTENGVNGVGLTINLNASATASDVKALIERVAYSSTDLPTNLENDRKGIGFVVTDGAGGQTQPDSVFLTLSAGASSSTAITLDDWLQPENSQSNNPGFSDVSFSETALNTAAVVIDSDVDLDDFNGNSFDGGFVRIDEVFTSAAAGILSVQDQGTAAGEIAFDGTTVQFGGTAIGTIDATSDGLSARALQINLNAAATAESVEALIEAFTYALNGAQFASTIGFDVSVQNGVGTTSTFVRGTVSVDQDLVQVDQSVDGEEQVNSFTAGEQQSGRVAALSDGGYVVIWTSRNQDVTGPNERGIFGQRYNENGAQVGVEFQINDIAAGDQLQPRVEGLSNGNFVVMWTESNARDISGQGVFGQVLQNDGSLVGAAFQVNDEFLSNQNSAQISDLGGGRFLATWSSQTSGTAGDGSSTGIFGRTFDATGAPEAGEFQINFTTGGTQNRPRTVELADGDVMVVWQDQSANDGSGSGVFAQRVANNGSLVSFDGTTPGTDEQLINTTTTGTQDRPDVAALSASATLPNGGFVFVWQSPDASGTGIFGQIYDIDGVAQGGEFQVNSISSGGQTDPVIIGLNNGGFAVAWSDASGIDGSGTGVVLQKYFADGAPDGGPVIVNEEVSSTQFQPELAELINGTLVATWTSNTSGSAGDGSSNGVFQALFDQPALPAGAMSPVLEGFEDTVTFEESSVNGGLQLLDQDGALSLTDMDSTDFDGGSLLLQSISGTQTTQQTLRGPGEGLDQNEFGIVDGAGITVSGTQVSFGGNVIGTIVQDGTAGAPLEIVFSGTNATPEAVETLLAQVGYANPSDNPDAVRQVAVQITDGDGGSTGSRVVTINVTPEIDNDLVKQGDEERVNTFTTSAQSNPATSEIYDSAGVQIGYVVIWQSQNQDRVQDTDAGIFGQRYDLNGSPVGAEFQVNLHTEFAQTSPAVTGLPTGGFVVSWDNNSWAHPAALPAGEGNSTGLIAQIFDENGGRVGTEFVVNDIFASTQNEVELAAKADGTIVAVYTDFGGADGSGGGVFMREFDNTGTALGASQQVNTQTSSSQSDAEVDVLAGGRVVVTWTSTDSPPAGDGSGNGVYARLFEADGTPVGPEFLVNSSTLFSQDGAVVTALADGGFVVVWDDDSGLDGSGVSVLQQRFDVDGTPVGPEVLVNETVSSTQDDPYVIALDDGGWIVSWSDASGADGSGTGVFAQRYAADGSPVDGQFQLNTEFSSTQNQSRLVHLGNDAFAAVWTSVTSGTAGDGNNAGVFQQIFDDGTNVSVSSDPIFSGLLPDLTLDEATLNTTGARIAEFIGVGDSDSADFNGGTLTVAMIANDVVQAQFSGPDGMAQDQLSLDQSGLVSVNNAGDVSVDGTVVGTITSDGTDGAALEISLNSNATNVTMQTLIRAVTYANTSDDPNAERLVSIQLTDGDGGHVRETVSIAITPEIDGAVVVDDEVQTNSFTARNQNDSHVAELADGGYVIVWTSNNQDGTGDFDNGVFAQRYDASGAPVGGEFQVNSTIAGGQFNAQVVGLSTGGFVIAWEDQSTLTGDDVDEEVVFQVYDANGQTLGSEVAVDSPDNFDPDAPALAAFGNGEFVLAYHARDIASPFLDEIYVQRYNDAGGAIGSENKISLTGTTGAITPDVAVQTDGTYIVVYSETPASSTVREVLFQRFAADDSAIGGPVTIDTFDRFGSTEPRIAATEDGGYVVTYLANSGDDFSYTTGLGVYAQRLDGAGNPVGDEILVNEVVDGNQSQPDVAAILGTGGGFAISYSDGNGTDGSGTGVFVQQYDAQGNRVDNPVQVNQEVSSTQSDSAIASLADGNFVVSFTSTNSGTAGDGDSDGVFHRILGDPADFAVGGDPILEGVNASVTYAENTLNGIPQLIDAGGAVAVSDPDSGDFDGGSILVSNVISSAALINQINAPDDLTQDQLGLRQDARVSIAGTAVSVDGTQVGTIVQDGQDGRPFEMSLNANATAEIVELLVEALTYRNISDDPLPSRALRIQITDGDGGASVPVLVTINITPTPDAATAVGGEQVVNTNTNTNDNPAIAQLPGTDGDFIVVYESFGTDGAREGVFAQRFDKNGNKLNRDGTGLPSGSSDEFQVNTTTAQDQFNPKIAAFSDGSWVVTWLDDTLDGNGLGVVFQRFNADGTLAGGEVVANNLTAGSQFNQDVAVLDDDRFVVTWQSPSTSGSGDGNGDGILARIFDATGAPVAGQFVVNTETVSTQGVPAITHLNDGGFLITWESFSSGGTADGNAYGIFGQRYDASGAAVGGEFQINTSTRSNQREVDVAVLEDGNLIVTWTDDVADLSQGGVFATIIAADGTPVTDEFRVNDQRISTQNTPSVAALDTGGFVIAWTDFNGTDGSGQGVFAQQYNAAGARIDSQFQVNTTFSGTQNQPVVEALPGGGFVVGWNGSVLIQVYGNETPSISPVAASGDEDTAIVLDAAVFDAGFFDPDGNTLQEIRIDTFPTNGVLALNTVPVLAGQIISRADLLAGNLVYTGNQDFNGSDSFLWTGSDGIAFSTDPSVAANITVDPVNDAPGLEAGADTSVGEGQALNRTLVLTDPDNDLRSFTVDYGDGSPVQTFDSTSLSPALNYVYGAEGTYTVTVTVDDNAGEANSVETDTFEVTVVNANPNATQDFFSGTEDDASITGNVLTNDTDPGGDPLMVTAVNGVAASVGTQITLSTGALLTLNADGSFDYVPNGQFDDLTFFQANDEFIQYEVSDGQGGTDTANLIVRVNGVNDAPTAQDDDLTVNDDSTLNGNVLVDNGNGADSDPDTPTNFSIIALNGIGGDIGSQITLGSGALLTLNADGTFDYDPNGQFDGGGTDSFTYTLSDGTGLANGTDTATVTISINATNVAPVAQDDAITTDEDTLATGSVLADNGNGADSDANGDALTVTEVNGDVALVGTPITLAGGGVLTVNSDGSYSFNPSNQYEALAIGETAVETFTYTIADGNGGNDTATGTITINGVNDAPVGVTDNVSTDEDSTVTGNVLTNDTDVDGSDTLTVLEVGGSTLAVGVATTTTAGGSVTINADGSFTYDPGSVFNALRAGFPATDSIQYTVSDGNGGTDVASLVFDIMGLNDGPTATDDAFNVGEDNVIMGDVTIDNGNGADSDPDTGDIPFIVEVNGNAGDIGTQIVLPSGALLTLNASGTFSYDPNGQFEGLQTGDSATDSFTYTLQDEGGAQDTATVTVTILGDNDAPVAVADMDSTDEDTALSGSVLSNDTDADGDLLSVSAVNGNAADVGTQIILPSGALLTLNTDGTYNYDPNGAFESLAVGDSTTDSFTYEVTDGNSGFDTATVTITVDGVNDAPIAGNDVISTDEDTALNLIDLFANNGGGVDVDPDAGDIFTVTEVNGSAINVGTPFTTTLGGVVTVNADGTASYNPNGAFETLGVGDSVTDSFTYTIDDGNGGTDTAVAQVIINGVNDAPDAMDDVLNVAVDAALAGNVLADNGNGPDTDIDASDTVSVSALNGAPAALGVPTTLASGAIVTLNSDGTFSYDQNGAFSGLGMGATDTDSFDYTITDGKGGFDTATVTITIGGSNIPPVGVDDGFSTNEDSAFTTGNVLANDTDANNDTLTVVGLDTTGTLGVVTDNGDGTFGYDPAGQFETLRPGQTAVDTFTYTVGDGNGGTDTATVSITITGVNDAPIAAADTLTVSEDAAGSVVVTSNDLDIEGTDLSILSIDTTGLTGTATVEADGDTITFNPGGLFESLAVGETATETFSYTVQDEDGGTDIATVTVIIEGRNDAPVAQDDALSTDEDTAIIGASVFADNGNGADTDVDTSDTFTVTGVNGSAADVGTQITLGSGALLTLSADGTFDYDPNGQFESLAVSESATDSFTYTIDDGNGGTDTATVTLTINGVNDAPVTMDDQFTTDEDTAVIGANVLVDNGSGADSDVDSSDTLTVVAVDGDASRVGNSYMLASGALLILGADGTFDYDPLSAFNGLAVGESDTDTFSYTISDGNGGFDTATVSVLISGVNDAPIAADDAIATDQDTTVTADLFADNGSGADSDPDTSDSFTVTAVNGAGLVGTPITLASGATLTVNADGTVSYDPAGNFDALDTGESATESFTYTIDDGNGGTSTATATVTIDGLNDAPVLVNTGPFDVLENTTAVDTISALDVDGDTLAFSIIGGADGGLFSIDSATGALTFDAAPDFEAPGDANMDNVYEVQVQVFDGDDTADAFVFVDVLDEDEGGGVNVIQGTDAPFEMLTGTSGSDEIRTGGGAVDYVTGGGGADTFVIEEQIGSRDLVNILDYEVGSDSIDLLGRSVISQFSTGASTYLFLDGDFDTIIVNGATSFGDITFV